MGLFSKLFGKDDKDADRRVEEEVNMVQSGAIDKIYPILKPGDWIGLRHGAVHQNLIGTGENKKLVIAFGYDAPTNFVFLMPHDMEGKDPARVFQEAYDNLEQVRSDFELLDALGNKVITASGPDFASEKILSESHMRRAHELLQADELLVSIPRRTCMMVTARNASQELLDTFVYMHNHTWQDDSYGNAQIINALFVVKGGKIEGIIPLGE